MKHLILWTRQHTVEVEAETREEAIAWLENELVEDEAMVVCYIVKEIEDKLE